MVHGMSFMDETKLTRRAFLSLATGAFVAVPTVAVARGRMRLGGFRLITANWPVLLAIAGVVFGVKAISRMGGARKLPRDGGDGAAAQSPHRASPTVRQAMRAEPPRFGKRS